MPDGYGLVSFNRMAKGVLGYRSAMSNRRRIIHYSTSSIVSFRRVIYSKSFGVRGKAHLFPLGRWMLNPFIFEVLTVLNSDPGE